MSIINFETFAQAYRELCSDHTGPVPESAVEMYREVWDETDDRGRLNMIENIIVTLCKSKRGEI